MAKRHIPNPYPGPWKTPAPRDPGVIRTLCGRELINAGTDGTCAQCETKRRADELVSVSHRLTSGQHPGTDGPVRFRATHGKRKGSCLRRGWKGSDHR